MILKDFVVICRMMYMTVTYVHGMGQLHFVHVAGLPRIGSELKAETLAPVNTFHMSIIHVE